MPFDETGSHVCEKFPKDVPASESAHRETPPVPSEFDRIVQAIIWAREKGAVHIKTPYIEIVFPPPHMLPTEASAPQVNSVEQDDAQAKAAIYKNPIDDPDYYSQAQDAFYDAKVGISEPR